MTIGNRKYASITLIKAAQASLGGHSLEPWSKRPIEQHIPLNRVAEWRKQSFRWLGLPCEVQVWGTPLAAHAGLLKHHKGPQGLGRVLSPKPSFNRKYELACYPVREL